MDLDPMMCTVWDAVPISLHGKDNHIRRIRIPIPEDLLKKYGRNPPVVATVTEGKNADPDERKENDSETPGLGKGVEAIEKDGGTKEPPRNGAETSPGSGQGD